MQYERGDGGAKEGFPILGELPKKNIDTGMGLERVAFLLQGVENIYEIDQVRPLIDIASDLSGKKYGANESDDVRMRVIADHIRSALMLMSDGVTPSNEGRGYVLRRLLRRSVRALRLLGIEEASFQKLFTASKNAMVDAYPELEESFERVLRAALAEEAGFRKTLDSGSQVLEEELAKTKSQLSGEVAFLLHDTYGFPIDLTVEIAEESGKSVDRDKFDELMQQQRDRAKQDAKSKRASTNLDVYREFRAKGETVFLGYESLSAEAKVLGLIYDGAVVDSLQQGQIGEVILDRTSLYAESGGQIADAGQIVAGKVVLEVLDVQKPVKGLFSHRVRVVSGEINRDRTVETNVYQDWRLGACQAHSATHVVHAALRQVLGPNALQSGSYNKPGYMRLDFAWGEALSESTKSEIEEVSNLAIRADLAVSAQFMTLPDAKDWGAIALFGETYDEMVRVVQVGGPWSRELCGGTHVSRSSQIGLVSLTGESSVGSGVRRIEAEVGISALRSLIAERNVLKRLSNELKAPQSELEARFTETLEQLKAAQKNLEELKLRSAMSELSSMVASAGSIGSHNVLAAKVDSVDSADVLRQLALSARDRLGEQSVVILAAIADSKPVVMVAVGGKSQSSVNAGAVAKAAAAVLGGGGGGKSDFAQAGGTDVSKLEQAIKVAKDQIS